MNFGKRFFKRVRAFLAKPLIVVQKKPVILEQEDVCANPIFLIGVHRSGTSLIRRMFNSHPDIACPPETFYLKKYCELYKDDMTSPGFKGFGLSQEDMRLHIRRQASELHEAFRVAHNKGRWADKTPQYTACIEQLLELFGNKSRFVMIFRDPRDIAYSIYERKWRFSGDENSGNNADILDETLEYVSARIELMLGFLSRHPDQAIDLWYEEVVKNPRKELGRVLAFLGEEFNESMLKFNEAQHNFGTEDPMVRGTSQLKLSGGYWRQLTDKERVKFESSLGPLADKLGYGK